MMMISIFFYLTHIICILSFSYLFCRFTFLQLWPHTNSMVPSPQRTLIVHFQKDKWRAIQVARKEQKFYRVVGRSLAVVHGDFRDMNQMWTTKGKNKAHVKAVQGAIIKYVGNFNDTLEEHNVKFDNLGFFLGYI